MLKLPFQWPGFVQSLTSTPVLGKTPQAPRFAPVLNTLERRFEALVASGSDRSGSPQFSKFAESATQTLAFADRISDPSARSHAYQRLRTFCSRAIMAAPNWLKPPLTELGMFLSNRDLRRLDQLDKAFCTPHTPDARRDLDALRDEVAHMQNHSTAQQVREHASRLLSALSVQPVADVLTPWSTIALTPQVAPTASQKGMLTPAAASTQLRRANKIDRRVSDSNVQSLLQPTNDALLGRSKSDMFPQIQPTANVPTIVVDSPVEKAPSAIPDAAPPAVPSLQVSKPRAKSITFADQALPQVSQTRVRSSSAANPVMAVAPPRPKRHKRKRRVSASSIAHLGLSKGLHLRELTSHEGVRYTISNSYRQGSFGKFRYCIGPDATPYAIKEFRSEFAKKPTKNVQEKNGQWTTEPKVKNKKGQWLTSVTSLEKIKKEIERIRQAGTNFKVHDLIEIDGKYYAVMTLKTGEVYEAAKTLRTMQKVAVGRSTMAQLADELAGMHDRGLVHGDVKLHNALFDGDGKVVVSDFGAVTELDFMGMAEGGLRSTYPAPEMAAGYNYRANVDVYSLGASFGDFFMSAGRNPFAWDADAAAMIKRDRAFKKWRNGLFDDKTKKIDMDRIFSATEPYEDPFDFGHYFEHIKTADAELCEVVLAKMLDPNPLTRASMRQIADELRLTEGGAAQNIAKAAYAELAAAGEQQTIIDDLKKYQDWAHPVKQLGAS